MKTLIHFGVTLSILISHLYAGAQQFEEKARYRNLEKTDAQAARVVERLESFRLPGVTISGEDVIDALETLRSKVAGDKRAGVINYVIRGSVDGQKVTIKADNISYAKVVDAICTQTGRTWTIEFMDRLGVPSLVIKEGKGQQPGTGQPATRPVVEPEGGEKLQPEAEGRDR